VFGRRRERRELARSLTAEFSGLQGPIEYRVKVVRRRGELELVVWPEAGIDTFTASPVDATDYFRQVVGQYQIGKRPPFDGGMPRSAQRHD
jgi:hypothetical protein